MPLAVDRHGRRATAGATLVAGTLTGLVDAVLVVATNPDSGLLSYRVAYVIVPVQVGALVTLAVGALAGRGRPALAVTAGGALWAAAIVADMVASSRPPAAIVFLGVALIAAAAASARLGLDIAARVGDLSVVARRRLATAVAAAAALATLASLPAAFAAFGGGTGPCAVGTAPAGQPNLVLVTVDALRADAAPAMESYRRLAARGLTFTQHTTLAPWTLPSIASLLTGLPPAAHGAGRSLSERSLVLKTPVAPQIDTLAGLLGARGYRTHAVVTNPFLAARYGVDRGFCSFENVSMEGETARAFAQTTPLRLARLFAPGALPSDRAAVVAARAARWLSNPPPEPFFLWVHFLDPHAPYGDRDGSSTSLTLDLLAFQARDVVAAPFGAIGLLRAGEYRPGPEARARIAALYREDVAAADRGILTLLDALAAARLTEHTAIVLTADHGEEFWEHGGVEHGRTLYEEVLRVPLVVVPPGGQRAAERSALTSVIDVAPTMLALAGLPTDDLPGVDLLAGDPPAGRRLALGTLLFGEEWTGVRTGTHKLLIAEHGVEQLYDLDLDPGERVDRAAADPDAVAALRPTGLPGLAPIARSPRAGRIPGQG